MTEKPFVHKKAFSDVYLNFIFQDEIAKCLLKVDKSQRYLERRWAN